MIQKLSARFRIALLLLALCSFGASYAATSYAQECPDGCFGIDPGDGSTCYRQANGNCVYTVDDWSCFDSCSASYGYDCCYIETGHCNLLPTVIVSSSICGGRCCSH